MLSCTKRVRHLATFTAPVWCEYLLLPKMRRVVTWSLLVFQALFVNVFLPAHTRGAITLKAGGQGMSLSSRCESPGNTGAPRAAPASCCAPMGRDPHPQKPAQPTPSDRACCAVCYIASLYVPVVPFDLALDLRDFVREAHDRAVAQVRSIAVETGFWANAPPTGPFASR